jgi:hypothetical protein
VVAIQSHRVYAEVIVGYGRPGVELVAQHASVRTVREGTPLLERVVAPTSVALPVEERQPLGSVQVYAGNRLVASASLVAASAVSEPGLRGKAVWYAKRTAHNIWGLVT